MTRSFTGTVHKLVVLAGLSMLGFLFTAAAQAHEVEPAVGDLTVADGRAELVLRLNIEAFIAGIDLDSITDTNDAENAAGYDVLRAMSAADIGLRAPAVLAAWNALPLVAVDGVPVALQTRSLVVPEDVDIELSRVSTWTLSGEIAPGTQEVSVSWPKGAGAMVLRQQGVDAPFTGYLSGGETSPAISLAGGDAMSASEALLSYIPVGFDHILPQGLDHILFVLGLFFLSTRWGPLLWQVTAFTLAHTVTLALGAAGIVMIPGSIVEPLIAASIVYVAVENIFIRGLSTWRPLVVFGFGLLHGLGFASVLGDFGLPAGQFVPALIGFNVGVELGQLTVIALAAILIWLSVRAANVAASEGEEAAVRSYPVMFRAVSVTGSLLIAIIGAWWVVERVFL
ncbi:HupE/UreJ family protein [Sulfitobacter sp. M57]|uniref:HupE/UreJ family protein n=1 Tax=unclassified Sulfitobacter TaxID=196795 RepID=UPI0023E0BA5D|nr:MULTISPECIES: HupE/UreJ family protein [unclassified Sulfitobacter]MDF3413783.1 HupE/UreJ family protein [Sulfitobacter sp. KE5]MDF3420936.1 HupE/UreJ family protein [Sulfitobacter sp. KE43]MDF3432329.1 HupE/UreJ family protein [Sulfitobacter sp. KE42]MDF3457968.1 HupE/UreJ family protein [Sulfitobacter sp. S74]MDF3461869.1 HupE/UreJ family protein [Sulfitobacter sp. Ks18]